MKEIITAVFVCLFAFGINGQDAIKPVKKINRVDVIVANTLFGSKKTGLGIRYKSLYEINNIFKVGWGAGIESYSSNLKRNFIPVSAEIIGDFFEDGRTPFYMLSMGYGIALKEDEDFAEESRGGIMLDFSIGYRSKKSLAQPFVSIGYRVQNAKYKGQDQYGNNDKEVVYKRWSLSAGIIF